MKQIITGPDDVEKLFHELESCYDADCSGNRRTTQS
jgi:hypothetical protein